MAKLKIAQVATSDMSVCFLLVDQIKALEKMGHSVIAICAPGPWVERIRSQGISVETVEMDRELSLLNDLRSFKALYNCFKKHKFDVVHTHTPKAGLLGPFAAQLAGIPSVVHTIHGLLFHNRMPLWKQIIFWLPEKITAICSDYLLSQSEEDVKVAIKTKLCGVKKITYLGNGIDITQFSPGKGCRDRSTMLRELDLRDEDIVIGSVGRLVYEKGFNELFAAAEEIIKKYDYAKFVVIGPEEKEQNDSVDPEQIEFLQQSGAVRFLDWQDDMPTWLSLMDMFVLPSHREGMPRVCMEAGAMMRPVIATDIRGCREVVEHGETGLLVPVKNPIALARAIEQLLDDKSGRKKMGQSGRHRIVKNFNREIVLERLKHIYSAIESRSIGH